MSTLHEKILALVNSGPWPPSRPIPGRLVVERPDEKQWVEIIKAICFHNLTSPRADWRVPTLGPVKRVLDLDDGEGLGGTCFSALDIEGEYALLIEPMNGGFSVRLQKRPTEQLSEGGGNDPRTPDS